MAKLESLWVKKRTRRECDGIRLFFEQYYVSLVLFAKTYVRDEDIAKDIVQDVFYVLVESHEKFDAVDNLKVYLYRAVRNRCLKHIRHEEVKGRYEQYVLCNDREEEIVYQERILEEEVFLLLNQAIRELPGQCEKVFLLTLEGKNNAEIAEILHISIETVKSHKKAGKKILYAKLKDIVSCSVLAFLLAILRD